ncbi:MULTISPECIES: glucurono-1,5-lactonase [Pseudomonas syringae group]|uniref:glucurono-1,5-lactonase n=1 Tax=Pseudomonas syringae group TaxID=136849 RepID=UPI0006D5E1A2|nr:SMP-30/gluconolactonase/LRE family protein [Pseudomonas coronafaciens]KPX34824.1 Gluconolactonase [Pseudomonas coronafaciens pv. garcae]RMS92518.1 Gluconolactonase [Pseudomonas coronafaciens pv. oryzae]RMS94490.1 Gluconolactonase [Pseudomonas coronafaciens pv. oryzae]RMV87091.1 Gluconolactonase [Pseudomonas coronafaciens pv. garcae]
MDAELIVDAQNATGESPVWSVHDQALYWVDIPAGRLHCWSHATGSTRSWDAPQMLACIAADSRGGWIAGMESGIFHLQPCDDGSLISTLLASVEHAQAGMRFNDGRCDRQGRFWAGTMLMDMSAGAVVGAMYRYCADQKTLDAQLKDFIVPNGLAFSPDGKTMYLSDSHPSVQKIWAFDYDPDNGTPLNRRLLVDMNLHPGRPDGAAMDTDGCYWICGNDAGLIHRFTPDGKLDRSLAVPVKKPAMCAFGGPGLDTLFVTSIRPGGDIGDQPLAGGVFALRPGVKGLEEPVFQG